MDTMYDLAEPETSMPEVPQATGKKKKEPYYPTVSFDVKQLPDLKGLDIGDKVMLHIEAEVCGIDAAEKRHTIRLRMKNGAADTMNETSKTEKSKKVSEMFKGTKKEESDSEEDY